MSEMDDNYVRESDNFDTERLNIKVNPRVVSTVCPRDRTVTQLLHNKPISDERMANIALAEIDLIHLAPLTLQRLCNALLTKREDVIFRFFESMAAITRVTIERAPDADPKRPASTFYRSSFLVNTISDVMPTNDERGTYFCVSFQDIFDVVFCQKPLSCSNRLKLSRVFAVFITSPCRTPSRSTRST